MTNLVCVQDEDTNRNISSTSSQIKLKIPEKQQTLWRKLIYDTENHVVTFEVVPVEKILWLIGRSGFAGKFLDALPLI